MAAVTAALDVLGYLPAPAAPANRGAADLQEGGELLAYGASGTVAVLEVCAQPQPAALQPLAAAPHGRWLQALRAGCCSCSGRRSRGQGALARAACSAEHAAAAGRLGHQHARPSPPAQVARLQVACMLQGGHRGATVTALKWCPDAPSRDLKSSGHVHLASGDSAGGVVVWDVVSGAIAARLDDAPPAQELLDGYAASVRGECCVQVRLFKQPAVAGCRLQVADSVQHTRLSSGSRGLWPARSNLSTLSYYTAKHRASRGCCRPPAHSRS